MKTYLPLLLLLVAGAFQSLFAQNVFNPADPIVRVNKSQPYGSTQYPDSNRLGLQKWVSTPTNGISTGTGTFDASSFKAYFINLNGSKLPFRIKFPRSYTTADSASKRYPVMVFLHGAGEVGCSSNGGLYNNEKQLWLGGGLFRDMVNNNQFDGFLVYPQLLGRTECWDAWGSVPTIRYTAVLAMLDSLSKYARVNIDRVFVNGLSGGGVGSWRIADMAPQKIASIAPAAAVGSTTNRAGFVHVPIWFATGGKDNNPSPSQALYAYNRMKEIGANIRYTQYPELGHSVWYTHWREPDYARFMNEMHKANPLVFFQQNQFCGQSVNVKIGITPGYYAYEWQKDGVTIATRTNGVNTIVNNASIITYTGNEVTVRSFGTYRVRFKRSAAAAWSEWSRKPALITAMGSPAAAPIAVSGIKSKVLPALDGSTTVPLTMPTGFSNYEWVRVSDNAVVGNQITYTAPVGIYKGRYVDQFGCPYAYSPNFAVVSAAGTPKPVAVTGLTVTALSLTSNRLNWTQGTGETNFEIYRGTVKGGPYQLLSITNANVTTYQDNGLNQNATYYYVIRAVNATGAAVASNEGSADNGNTAPLISTLTDMYVKTDASGLKNFTITDNPGDVVTVTVPSKPPFVTLHSLGGINYRITAAPLSSDVGWHNINVVAKDNKGKVSTRAFIILVADKSSRSVFVNFGSAGKTAPAPWNNWLGIRGANNIISNLKDENNLVTTIDVTTVSAWSSVTDMGHITGNNTGVYPDAVLQSGIADNGAAKQIRISGLNPAKRYNLSFVGSQNEGLLATANYVSGTQSSILDARYNTHKTSNLNGLIPDASGNILVTATRTGGSLYSYLNAMVIEEYTPSTTMMSPINLHVEPVDRTTVNLVWSDRTNSESPTAGYEIKRATDASFTVNLVTINLAGNITSYKNTGLAPNTKYYYRVRAKNGTAFSGYSNTETTITPVSIVYVNFNTNVPNAATPWNNLQASPNTPFGKSGFLNQSGTATSVVLNLTKIFNGEFNAGKSTGNNSGIVPDNVLKSNFWLDRGQQSQFRISGLNTTRRYRIGFVGSSSAVGWFKGNYTATYSINDRTVYLNSWENSTKIVYIGDIVPEAGGIIHLNFTTTPAGVYGFNAGVIIQEYIDTQGGIVTTSVVAPDEFMNLSAGRDSTYKVSAYPNPFNDLINLDFYNNSAGNRISAEVYDLTGRLVLRQYYNALPAGHNTLRLRGIEATKSTSVCLIALKVNGKIVETVKVMRNIRR